jgi:hypothetical protein
LRAVSTPATVFSFVEKNDCHKERNLARRGKPQPIEESWQKDEKPLLIRGRGQGERI